jgi:hypothetical protein
VTPAADHLALIDAGPPDDGQAGCARMMAQPPAMASTGKGAPGKMARELAASLTAASR